jgi:hypothetical protein
MRQRETHVGLYSLNTLLNAFISDIRDYVAYFSTWNNTFRL